MAPLKHIILKFLIGKRTTSANYHLSHVGIKVVDSSQRRCFLKASSTLVSVFNVCHFSPRVQVVQVGEYGSSSVFFFPVRDSICITVFMSLCDIVGISDRLADHDSLSTQRYFQGKQLSRVVTLVLDHAITATQTSR